MNTVTLKPQHVAPGDRYMYRGITREFEVQVVGVEPQKDYGISLLPLKSIVKWLPVSDSVGSFGYVFTPRTDWLEDFICIARPFTKEELASKAFAVLKAAP